MFSSSNVNVVWLAGLRRAPAHLNDCQLWAMNSLIELNLQRPEWRSTS